MRVLVFVRVYMPMSGSAGMVIALVIVTVLVMIRSPKTPSDKGLAHSFYLRSKALQKLQRHGIERCQNPVCDEPGRPVQIAQLITGGPPDDGIASRSQIQQILLGGTDGDCPVSVNVQHITVLQLSTAIH